ncbi:MAG: hypothetical protein QXI39_06960 [Candidatus Bathyarchaeia archaeon]
MGDVGLRYPGFILFASRLLSVLTGMLFVIIVTRNLSSYEFGVWGNMGDLLAYFTMIAYIMPFWSKRFLGRGYIEAAKTGVFANLLFCLPVLSVYAILIPSLLTTLGVSQDYWLPYLLIGLQIPETYVIVAFESILHIKKPQAMGYGLLVYEASKLAAAYSFVFHLSLGLLGAVYAVITAYGIQIFFYLTLVREHLLAGKVRWSYIREWVKGSFLNIYEILGGRISSIPLILLFAYGGSPARAYYGAARTIASVIGYSSSLSLGLYPRLLAKADPKDASTALNTVLMFALPMTAGAIVLSDSYMMILNPVYLVARPILIILSIQTFFGTLSGVFDQIVLGVESLDEKASISIRNMVRSKIFKLFSIPYVFSALTITLTFQALLWNPNDPLESAMKIGVILTAFDIAQSLVKYKLAISCLNLNISNHIIVKYISSSLVMLLILLVIHHPTTIRETLVLTAFGGTIYLSTLCTIDIETRKLVFLIFERMKLKIQDKI